MRRPTKTTARAVLLVTAAGGLLVTGCPNPSNYATPRTTAEGRFSHSIGIEAYRATVEVADLSDPNNPTTEEESVTIPTAPSYQLRYGATDGLDLGLKISNLSSIGGDVKWNFLKSNAFDAAIDPGVQYYSISVSAGDSEASTSVLYFHVPVLLGLNLAESVSVVFSPGASFARVSADVSSSEAMLPRPQGA